MTASCHKGADSDPLWLLLLALVENWDERSGEGGLMRSYEGSDRLQERKLTVDVVKNVEIRCQWDPERRKSRGKIDTHARGRK